MTAHATIRYQFSFPDGEQHDIPLRLNEETLAFVPAYDLLPPQWAELAFNRCTVCTLDPGLQPHCPIALHLAWIVEMFRDHSSCDEVSVTVDDSRRRYYKETSLQKGLGSLLGILMVTGGCPALEPLRPMVRFHLPFASMEETEFRMVSMYLAAQYLRMKKGLKPDWSLQGLQVVYDRVRDVNTSFSSRIRSASVNDAEVNALVILDCFAKAVPFAIRTMMKEYEKFFASHSMSE